MKTVTKKSSKTTKTPAIKTVGEAKAKAPRVAKSRDYSGAPIEASRLFLRVMDGFKNSKASVMVAINDAQGTVTYLNLYRDGHLPASFDPAPYTFAIVEKKLAAKLEQFKEIEDRDEWPEFIRPAAMKRKARATK